MDPQLAQSEEVVEIANFALGEFTAGKSSFADDDSLFLAVSNPDAEGGDAVHVKVLEAQRQVR